jgi:hypothetical protein
MSTFFPPGSTKHEKLEMLKQTPMESLIKRRGGVINGKELEDLAKELKIRHANVPKSELVKNLLKYKGEDEALEASTVRTDDGFRRDANTFPRLLNFLMKEPNAVARLQLLAARHQLDSGEVYSSQEVMITAVELFNDPGMNSGGLIDPHQALRKIDPEKVPNGELKPEKAWKILLDTKKLYAEAKKNFHASGSMNSDFHMFCCHYGGAATDVLYLYLWLVQLNCTELNTFFESGNIIEGGFDTATNQSSSCVTTPKIKSTSGKATSSTEQSKEMKRFNDIREMEAKAKTGLISLKKRKMLFEMQEDLATKINKLPKSDGELKQILRLQLNSIQLEIDKEYPIAHGSNQDLTNLSSDSETENS